MSQNLIRAIVFVTSFLFVQVVNGQNNLPTGRVVITGSPHEGQTLTSVISSIFDLDNIVFDSFTYQWRRDGVDIADATQETYVVTSTDRDTDITVLVSFVDGGGTTEQSLSDGLAIETNRLPTGGEVTGILAKGQTVTADTSGITDADGLSSPGFTYQWCRDGVSIPGETNQTYVLVDEDVGTIISVLAIFIDDESNNEVIELFYRDDTILIAISEVGFSLQSEGVGSSLDTSNILAEVSINENTIGDIVTTTILSNSNNLTYSLNSEAIEAGFLLDENTGALSLTLPLDYEALPSSTKYIDVVVTVTGEDGFNVERMLRVQVSDINDLPVGNVIVTGKINVGEVLTVDISSLSDDDGLSNPTYQWHRGELNDEKITTGLTDVLDGTTVITSATNTNYTLTTADIDTYLYIVVSYTSGSFTNMVVGSVRVTDNIATKILDSEASDEINLEEEVMTILAALEDVIDNSENKSAMDDLVIETLQESFESDSISTEEKLAIIKNVVPSTHATIAPAIETVIKDAVDNLKARSLAATDNAFISLNGAESPKKLKGLFWYGGTHSSGDRDKTENASGYEYSGYSVRMGYERSYGSTFLGINTSYSDTSVENTGNSGKADLSTVSIGFYGSYHENNVLILASVVLAQSDIDVERMRPVLGNLNGDTTANSADVDFTYGYVFKSHHISWTPLIGLRYNYVNVGEIEEEGGLNVKTLDSDYDSLYVKLGGMVTFNLNTNKKNAISLFADWNFNVLDRERDITSQFISGSDSFEVKGVDQEEHTVSIGVIWNFSYKKNIFFELGYNYRTSSISQSHNLIAKAKHRF